MSDRSNTDVVVDLAKCEDYVGSQLCDLDGVQTLRQREDDSRITNAPESNSSPPPDSEM